MAQCKAKKTNGERCRNNAISGKDFCYIISHGNAPKSIKERFSNFAGNHKVGFTIGVLGLLFGLLSVFQVWLYYRDKKENANTGILYPEEITILSAEKGIYPEMQFGDSESILRMSRQSGELLGFAKESGLFLAINKGKIEVTVQIRDKTGAIVAEIIRNEWKTAMPPSLWDRNYSHNALEVKDSAGDIVLQIKLEGSRVQLQGRFYNSQGYGIEIVKGIGEDGKIGGLMAFPNPQVPPHFKIHPMFKYPSNSHLGETIGYLQPADRLDN